MDKLTIRKPVNIFITVDTEASVAGAFSNPEHSKPQLSGPVDGLVSGRSEALGFLLRKLKSYNLKATFFTESLQTRYFGYTEMQTRVEAIIAAGQDVQLHVHPCWLSFENGQRNSITPNDQSTNRTINELIDIFIEAKQRFAEWGIGSPMAVRTGNFSAGLDTFEACKQAGLMYSSNVASGLNNYRSTELQIDYGIKDICGVKELPLTNIQSYTIYGKKIKKILAITACSAAEMISALEQAWENKLDSVCILTHPFEFIHPADSQFSSCKINRLNHYKAEKLFKFIANNSDRFQTKTFSDLAKISENIQEYTGPQLTGSYNSMILRTACNFINDTLVKRFF